MVDTAVEDAPSTSSVEALKLASGGLRGDLVADLEAASTGVSAESHQLLKFHGIYSQDDRDQRRALAAAGRELAHIFMARVAIPGGALSSEQWLVLDQIAEDLADGSIRLTTRQAVQFHGVAKRGLRPLAHALHEATMTTFAACGDVVRNTVMCPSLWYDDAGDGAELARRIATTFKPRTRAHWEIFVGGELAASAEVEHDFYGATFLPRKFKIAIGCESENCVDILAQDLGLVPVTHPERGRGYSVFVGGGLGRSYAQEDTFARLAEPLAFVTSDEVLTLITAVLSAYRDLGDRTNRRRARLKYVVADLGLAAFRREVESRWGSSLTDPVAITLGAADDHLGWRSRGATFDLGIRVGAGRVRDTEATQLRSALREIAATIRPGLVITAQQDVVLTSVTHAQRPAVERILAEHGVLGVGDLGAVQRQALACPALPTCGQALAESERVLESVVERVQSLADSVGASRRPLQLRMTGCPNGCARPAVAEIGVVGRTKTTYDLFIGGGPRGDRLARIYREKVKLDDLDEALRPLMATWAAEAEDGEPFGDFVTRRGLV
ncbi:MAG: NADPH-dependent assimilatory sulfite reductase hemoprotein subunit [Acidobacteriota bacterium]|nr:NADPH-dependent assimilatory sulfite reductase hemoprotein subunit [Acidobacteriota bacterium]